MPLFHCQHVIRSRNPFGAWYFGACYSFKFTLKCKHKSGAIPLVGLCAFGLSHAMPPKGGREGAANPNGNPSMRQK